MTRLILCCLLIGTFLLGNAQTPDSTLQENTFSANSKSEMAQLAAMGFTFSDSSYPIIEAKYRDALVLFSETAIQLNGNYDTAYLVNRIPQINTLLNDLKAYLAANGNQQSLRSLNGAYGLTKQLLASVKKFEKEINVSYYRLVKIGVIKNELETHPIFKILPIDSIMRGHIIEQSFVLNQKWSDVDSLRNVHLKKLGAILVKLSNLEFLSTEVINMIKGYMGIAQTKIFSADTKPLFQAAPSLTKTIDDNFAFDNSVNYLASNPGYFIGYLLFILLVWAWLNYNIRKLEKNGATEVLAKVKYIYHNRFTFSVAVASVLLPLFLPNPTNLLVELPWLIFLMATIFIGGKVWEGKMRWGWACFLLFFILFALDNLYFVFSVQERWEVFFLSLLAIVWASYMIFLIKKTQNSSQGVLLILFWLFLIGQVLSVLLNIGGWFGLSKVLNIATVIALNIGVGMHLLTLVLGEAIYLQLEVGKTGVFDKIINFHSIEARYKPISNFIAIAVWLLSIIWGLGFFYYLSEQFILFLDAKRALGAYEFTFKSIFIFISIIAITSLVASFLNLFYSAGFDKNKEARSTSWILILRLIVLAAGFLIAMAAAGIPFDKLAIVIGGLGVGIGFGLQNIVNNLFSGIILVFEKPMRIGDTIEVGDKSGVVKEIGIRSSKILSSDGADVYIPNGDLLSAKLINWTNSNHNRKVEFKISVSKDENLDKVMESIQHSLASLSILSQHPAPVILVNEITDNAVVIKIVIYALESSQKDLLRSTATKQVFDDFNSISIAYPTSLQDIYVKELPK